MVTNDWLKFHALLYIGFLAQRAFCINGHTWSVVYLFIFSCKTAQQYLVGFLKKIQICANEVYSSYRVWNRLVGEIKQVSYGVRVTRSKISHRLLWGKLNVLLKNQQINGMNYYLCNSKFYVGYYGNIFARWGFNLVQMKHRDIWGPEH